MAPKVKEKVLAAARVTSCVVDGSQAITKVLRKHTASRTRRTCVSTLKPPTS